MLFTMAADRAPPDAYRFGPFRLRVPDRILERDGERIQLTPKVIDTLFVLVENAGQVVAKDDMMKAVWPDVTVVESGLTRNISALRKALEEGLAEGSFIETIPRRGYRFVAEVAEERRSDIPAMPPVDRRKVKLRPVWLVLAGAVIVSLASLWLFLNPASTRSAPGVDPFVRIGEHLLYKLAPEETIRAAEHFERAIAGNATSAGAHAGLAVALVHLLNLGVRRTWEALPRAEEAARKAVQLDARSSAAHYAVASVHMIKDWNFRAADTEFRRALELQPDSVQTRFGYAKLKLTTGDIDGAQQLVEEALRLDPASPPLGVEYCRVFYYLRDFRRAESECGKVLDREPGYSLAHYYTALSQGYLGRLDEAHRSLDRSGLLPGVIEVDRAWLSMRKGERRPALSALETRHELLRQGKVDATANLLLLAMLDRIDELFQALEVGLATRAPELLTIDIEPRFDSMRNDPRYPALLRRIGIQGR